jgi:hypothetical protein
MVWLIHNTIVKDLIDSYVQCLSLDCVHIPGAPFWGGSGKKGIFAVTTTDD